MTAKLLEIPGKLDFFHLYKSYYPLFIKEGENEKRFYL